MLKYRHRNLDACTTMKGSMTMQISFEPSSWAMRKPATCLIRNSLLLGLFFFSLATLSASSPSPALKSKLAGIEDPHLRRILTNSVNVGIITTAEELDQVLLRVHQKNGKILPPPENDLAQIYTYLQRRERALPESYRSVMTTIRSLGISNMDIYCGSHIVCRDGGTLYRKWAALGAFPRISSHYKGIDIQQFELRLEGIGSVLFGKTGEGDTWFQMEAHSASLTEAFPHLLDYFKYRMNDGDNVGPLGTSPRNDGNPLVVDPGQNNTGSRRR